MSEGPDSWSSAGAGAETDRPRVVLPGPFGGHPGSVFAVAFSPDSRLLASGGWDGTIRLWAPDTGEQVRVLRGHRGAVRALAFTPDGAIVSVGRDQSVRRWDTGTGGGEVLARLTAVPAAVHFAADGRTFAAAFHVGPVQVWTEQGGLSGQDDLSGSRVVALSPDGSQIAVAVPGGAVHLLPVSGQEVQTVLHPHLGDAHALIYMSDESLLIAGSSDGPVPILGKGRETLVGIPNNSVTCAARSPDNQWTVIGADDGQIASWRAGDELPAVSLPVHLGPVAALAFSPDGSLLASAGIDGAVHLWRQDESGPRNQRMLTGHVGEILSVAYHPDGTTLATGDVDGVVRIWETRRGSMVGSISGPPDWVRSLAYNAEGTHLAAVIGDRGVVWDVTAGFTVLSAHERRRGTDPALVHAAELLADPGDGAADAVLAGRTQADAAVAVSAQRTLAAEGGRDGLIRLWSLADPADVRTLTGHRGTVRGLAFAPDGRTLISVGDDGRIIEWHVASGSPMRGSGIVTQSMPQIPGLRSDNPSPVDLLGMSEDVRTLAALIAAAGTRPPLAIALLGEWGSGKSSVMLQVEQTVADLAAQSRRQPGFSLFAENVRQVRFNAWHYADDQVWTGLVDHLLRTLAADPDAPDEPSDADAVGAAGDPAAVQRARTRLGDRLAAKQADLVLLDRRVAQTRRIAALRAAAWQDKWTLLFGAGGALVSLGVQVLGLRAFGGALGGRLAALLRPKVDTAESGWERGRSTVERARGLSDGLANYLDTAIKRTAQEVAALEDQLARIDAATRLAVLLKRHADSDTYGGYRGLVGQVHHDLEQLDTALEDLRAQRRRDGDPAGAMPLERIVLYVDDLDRCPPARVMEVLAAVHLMLALPLFVVVVAVDPRWLIRALREHYGDMLSAEQETGEPVGSALDYLDKIFQIPFAVPKPRAAAMGDFLLGMLGEGAGPDLDRPDQQAAPRARRHSGSSAIPRPRTSPDAAAADVPADARPATAAAPGRSEPDAVAPGTPPAVDVAEISGIRDLRPGGLVLHRDEAAFMARLGPLLPTPRAAKKLANLYRLVRIGVTDERLPGFIGTGEYRSVQILLAVLVSVPTVVPGLFTAIRAAADDADLVTVIRGAQTPDPAACDRIARLLAALRLAVPDLSLDAAGFRDWCPQLARYSFHTLALADALAASDTARGPGAEG